MTVNVVIWPEQGTVGRLADRVHGARFQIDEDGTWDVLVTVDLRVVHVDAVQLEVIVTVVVASRIDSMLI